jgi:hypothetical protein
MNSSCVNGSRDSAVCIAIEYELDDRGFGVPVPEGSRIFSTSSRQALGLTQPSIQWGLGEGFFSGVKRSGREADHLPPSSAEVYTSTPAYAFRDNFTFILTFLY